MTTKQKQWQLYFLGYYGSSERDIDGIWGQNSMNATEKFQKAVGITSNKIFGSSTEAKTMEIIDNVQDVVTKYADKPLVNDGLAGPATMEATRKYQKAVGLPVTGKADTATLARILETVGPECGTNAPVNVPNTTGSGTNKPATGTFWDDIKYFDRNEFKCKCGGRYCNGYPAEMREDLIRIAEAIRIHFGVPVDVSSGLRCRQHNANEGGVANSQHMYGEAMDIRVRGKSAAQVLTFVKTLPGVRYAYAINSSYVHIDVPKGAR